MIFNLITQETVDKLKAINEAAGNPILLKDSANSTLIDFKIYGKSIQNGTPTPVSPIEIKSVGDIENSLVIKNNDDVFNIPLSAPIRSVGNVKDEVNSANVIRRTIEIVYDGSSDEGWSKSSSYSNIFFMSGSKLQNVKLRTMLLCSHYAHSTNVADANCYYGINLGDNLNVKNKDINTLDEWKAWLQANPMTVVYELIEPVIEEIEPVEIYTYENLTDITCSDSADMWVKYYVNSNIGKQLAEQAFKNVLSDEDGNIQVNVSGQVVELIVIDRALNQLLGALTQMRNFGLFPIGNVTTICRYGEDNKIGYLEIIPGSWYELYDILTNERIDDYMCKVTFNATWITDKKMG